uniref:Solute carrier family 13 member 5 n=1 Tax=Plectus sambesii TaxID=2011161 RepID=A0A914WFF9_9BILA
MMLLREIRVFWKAIVTVLAPIALVPLLLIGTSEAKCAFVVSLMAIYWLAEVVPLAVTSFLPIFLFPVLGVLQVTRTCENYLKDTNFLFVGGLIMAVAIEECNLHKRIALKVLTWVGAKPRWLMAGFMAVTAFLSMWVSNTATTAMMAPIAYAVLQELFTNSPPADTNNHHYTNVILNVNDEHHEMEANGKGCEVVVVTTESKTVQETNAPQKLDFTKLNSTQRGICKAVLVSICYSANIGGTGTLTGTGPNLVLRGQLDTYYKGSDTGISFASWMAFAVPPMVVYLILAWLLLQLIFCGPRSFLDCWRRDSVNKKAREEHVKQMIRNNYDELGPMSFAEWSTLGWFIVLVVLWIMRDPRFIPGWASWFGSKSSYISDSSSGMFVACVLFAWPSDWPDFLCWREDKNRPPRKRSSLINWNSMQKFPWSVIMLLGGAFALADGVKASNLSIWVGCNLQHALGALPPASIIAVFTIIITFVTEVSSNSATASIFVPIMLSVAENLKVNPLYFALPATIAPSFAFMLPVATPPNAIIYETKAVRIIDMMIAGFVMNCLCIAVILLNINTYAYALFDLGSYPEWATKENRTSLCS